MTDQTNTENNPNAQRDIELLTARVISQEPYILLADKHIALLERSESQRLASLSYNQAQNLQSQAAQNVKGASYGAGGINAGIGAALGMDGGFR